MKTDKRIFSAHQLYHFIFWIAYFLFNILSNWGIYGNNGRSIPLTIIYNTAHILLFYFIYYFAIPKLFNKGKFLLCVLIFIVVNAIVASSTSALINVFSDRNFDEKFFNFFVYNFTTNVYVAGMLVGGKLIIDNLRNRKLIERIKSEQVETELHYLKAQVNPHFLFNSINNICVLIQKDSKKAVDTLIKLSEMLRSQLYEFTEKEITIEDEMQYLENYIELERLRKGDNLIIEIEKHGSLSNFKLPPLLLIPFLENCFKFVSNKKNGNNWIKLCFSNKDGKFMASFSNSVQELNDKVDKFSGIGLKNIKRRLSIIYPNNHELVINNNIHSYTVDLIIYTDGL